MYQLFLVLRDICQLRRGPQDLPYAPTLLLAACVADLVLQLAISALLGIEGNTLLAGIIGLAFNLGILMLLLNLRGVSNRFMQSAFALLACGIFFTLLVVPILVVIGAKPPQAVTPLQGLLAMIALPIMAWKLCVDAHILRHSLNVPFFGGMLIAVLWAVGELALGAVLRGDGPAA